jgi:hypothetical protein
MSAAAFVESQPVGRDTHRFGQRPQTRPWVEVRLAELREQLGQRAFKRAVVAGVRLRAGEPADLPLAA